MDGVQRPVPPVTRLAERVRTLRENEFGGITQRALGRALGDADKPVSHATISMWETSERIVPESRLERYARLYCTERSFEGEPHLIDLAELDSDERSRLDALLAELLALRGEAAESSTVPPVEAARSMWHFPDGWPITLACSRLPENLRPPQANPLDLHYVKFSDLADLDALIDIYGAIRAYNPRSPVTILAAQDLTRKDAANHLVLIGGLAWQAAMPWFERIFPIPIEAGDPAERGALVARVSGGETLEFPFRKSDGEDQEGGGLIEDVGFFARGKNPTAPKRTLTICGGITTRGVRGAAQSFIDPEMRENNERYLHQPRFPEGSTYCIVMRVPIVNKDPITPDLSKKENRLLEWCDADN
jgi:hypothetical protein